MINSSIAFRSFGFWGLALIYMVLFSAAEPWLAALFKVLPILLLAMWAYIELKGKSLLLAALLLGGVGDVLLALGYFIPGLMAFLIGHMAYILLWRTARVDLRWWLVIPIMLFMLVAAVLILPDTGELLLPVSVYLVVITVMAITAAGSRLINVWGVIGICSFLISDFILAWNEYVDPITMSVTWVMASYYLAQYSICRSVIDCHNKR